MAGQTNCATCGQPVPMDLWDEASDRRTPCTKCQSTARTHSLKVESGVYAMSGSDVTLTVVRYPEVLFQTAERLFGNGEYGVAVVVAHTACEVAVERVISQSFASSSIPQVADAIDNLLNGYNIANSKVHSLFKALTGRDVALEKQSIWSKFHASVKRRNETVHTGKQPTRAEAEESMAVAREMVGHLVALIQ